MQGTKILIDPVDFEKLKQFVFRTSIGFERVEHACEVKDILLNRCETYNIKIEETINKQENGNSL